MWVYIVRRWQMGIAPVLPRLRRRGCILGINRRGQNEHATRTALQRGRRAAVFASLARAGKQGEAGRVDQKPGTDSR